MKPVTDTRPQTQMSKPMARSGQWRTSQAKSNFRNVTVLKLLKSLSQKTTVWIQVPPLYIRFNPLCLPRSCAASSLSRGKASHCGLGKSNPAFSWGSGPAPGRVPPWYLQHCDGQGTNVNVLENSLLTGKRKSVGSSLGVSPYFSIHFHSPRTARNFLPLIKKSNTL